MANIREKEAARSSAVAHTKCQPQRVPVGSVLVVVHTIKYEFLKYHTLIQSETAQTVSVSSASTIIHIQVVCHVCSLFIRWPMFRTYTLNALHVER